MKQILKKIIFPRLAVVILSVPVAAALLVYTFLWGRNMVLLLRYVNRNGIGTEVRSWRRTHNE